MRYSAKYADRGVVGVGLGGLEAQYPPEPYAPVFELAKAGGPRLGAARRRGGGAGVHPRRARCAGADRIRHGFRAVEDAALVAELARAGASSWTSPRSRTSARARSASLAEHPLPKLVAAGVRCSISTDDPAMFDTDLTRDYAAASSLGVDPRSAYEAGVEGALCDEATRKRLRQVGRDFDWTQLARAELV